MGWKAKADAEAASRRATDTQVLERLIGAWNERQAARMPMLFSPTIGAANEGRAVINAQIEEIVAVRHVAMVPSSAEIAADIESCPTKRRRRRVYGSRRRWSNAAIGGICATATSSAIIYLILFNSCRKLAFPLAIFVRALKVPWAPERRIILRCRTVRSSECPATAIGVFGHDLYPRLTSPT